MEGEEQAARSPDPARGAEDQDEAASSRWIVELVGVVVVAILVAVLLRTFVVATYSIPSGSMEPTLQVGDRIVVDKLSYHLHGVDRGNIVVFSTPPNEDCAGPPVADLVKRVIGLPGEIISLQDAVPPAGRTDGYLSGTFEQWLCTAPRVSDPPGRRLRHGRQSAPVV
jgi:signal peptidase I